MIGEFFRNYAPNWLILWLVAMFLAYPERDVIQITIGLMFMTAWIYFIHRALHELPKDGVIGSLNTHWRFHHGPEKRFRGGWNCVWKPLVIRACFFPYTCCNTSRMSGLSHGRSCCFICLDMCRDISSITAYLGLRRIGSIT